MKAWFFKFHRWLALVFALPLAVVIVTGLILSFEPWLVTRAIQPDTLNPQKIQALLSRHDPGGQVRALSYRSYDQAIVLGAGRGGGIVVDAVSGQVQAGSSVLASVLGASRGLHEALLANAGWLVTTSTAAMLIIAILGTLMGWPRLANTLAGWHKAMAWGLLPLVVLSPLTALLMAAGVTFTTLPPAAPAAQGPPLTLPAAVQILGRDHDLSTLIWMRPMGGRLLARLAEGGEYTLYAVTNDGATALQRNWPRLWHEGNFAGAWSAAMNVIISVAMIGLLTTGLWIWLRRTLRRRARRSSPA
ncbi:MAG: PepSY domain-containing protein [Rhodoplanes sp.]|uniref:PepSY-associated TM helix domain-containing protein n=1 Tax=Rhodoplanes sp. TaxID=1968906 RepID=UPI0017AB143D|nr:PepSY-associated TM helix domain-containing protein [Rhodoplanes sp.]NVO14870.1 PepSY domain-containing protein [Rhodoplanes sp.]